MMRLHQIAPRLAWAALALALVAFVADIGRGGSARAEGTPRVVLRMATIAPEGTAWAREIRALSRDVEAGTHGEVTLKWYFGGIAGRELDMAGRIKRGQLDGAASGGPLCMQVSPTMRVMRVPGLFNSREEAAHVVSRLKPTLDAEFRAAGFTHLTSSGLGHEMVFSRRPIRSLEELRATAMWRWDQDEPSRLTDPALGLKTLPLPIEDGVAAYDEQRIDGFYVVPTAALAFQYYSRVRYLLPLRVGLVWGCVVLTTRAWDRLPVEHQNTLRTAAVKFGLRMEEVGREQESELVAGRVQKPVLTVLPVTEALRAEFLAAARHSRDQLVDTLVPSALLQQVLAVLADYRSEHGIK